MVEESGEESGGGELAGAQETAFLALRAGQSFAQAAQVAGVGRATVYRWVQSDPHFQAAYNAWKREMSESANARLLKLADRAVDVIEKSLDQGDAKTAVAMLKHLAVMRKPREGSTDVQTLTVQRDLQERRLRFDDVAQTTKLLLDKAGFSPADRRRYIRKHGYMGVADQFKKESQRRIAQQVSGPVEKTADPKTSQATDDPQREPSGSAAGAMEIPRQSRWAPVRGEDDWVQPGASSPAAPTSSHPLEPGLEEENETVDETNEGVSHESSNVDESQESQDE